MGEKFDSYTVPRAYWGLQKSRVDPSKISLPPAPQAPSPPPDVVDDESTPSNANGDESNLVSAEVLERAEESFMRYTIKNYKQLNAATLREMCRRRELETTGYKIDLFARLSQWASDHFMSCRDY